MGSCYYYAAIRDVTTKEQADEIRALWEQGTEAEQWWQAHRVSLFQKSPEECAEAQRVFWQQFAARFPEIEEYLRVTCPLNTVDGDCNNAPAGFLCWTNESIEWLPSVSNLRISGEVWHCADWDKQAEEMQRRFGLEMDWLSEEDLNPFDLLSR